MTTAAIYARISTDKRKGTDEEGTSVANQLDACRRFIKAKGWKEGTVYKDNSISATTGALRPAFERMLTDAPPVVVVWRQDRLERGVAGTNDLDRFIMAGCEGYTADGERISFESASQEFMTRMKSLTAGYEQRLKSERQKLASLANAKAGKWAFSRPQFGNDWKTGKLIPEEADAINNAGNAIAEGKATFYTTAKDWNARGFTTPTTTNGFGGRLWEPGTVRQFFQAERLTGRRTYAGETRVMVGWEPILTVETWEQIQLLIEAKKTGRKGVQGGRYNPGLLTGIAKCAMCGKGLNAGQRGGPGSDKLYRCTTPGHLSRKADTLERFIVDKFLYLLMHDGAEQIINPDGHKSTAPLRAQRSRLILAHTEWITEAVEAGLKPSVIAQKETKHAEAVAAIDAQLLHAVKDAVFTDLLPKLAADGPEALWERWLEVPVAQQREIILALFADITIHKSTRSHKFDPKLVELTATPLMLELVDLNP